MTSRHRTTSSSRKDSYGLWRPSDSDSDRPRQTMASTQRHNVNQAGAPETHRKHHSSRRVDAIDYLDPSATYSRSGHKSSSKDRSSTAQPSPYYAVPPSPNPSAQYQTRDPHHDLRAYLKKSKRSPRSHEKVLAGDEVKVSRSGQRSGSRHAYPDPATYTQASLPSQSYPIPSTHATRDTTASSRHHRDREKDREKLSSRDPEKVKIRDHTAENSEERERRKRREKDGEKERPSKDKERRKEKNRHKEREAQPLVETKPADSASIYQGYAQVSTVARRSADKIPVAYPEYTRPPSTQPHPVAHVPAPTSATVPWAGLTSAERGAAASVPDPAYSYASDKDDPPLPIPPPERRRERTSSKPHRSHHHKVSQQVGQDSGLSSSEQEHSIMDRSRTADRRYTSREQASTLQRGYSSGPSGSENERAPTVQKERHKHKSHGESARHKPKSASIDAQPASGTTTSQEIANAWYQRSSATADDTSAQRPANGIASSALPAHTSVHTSGKPTSSVGLTTSQRAAPRIVSIRAGQGPADPQTSSVLPKIHSGTTPSRQPESLPMQYYQGTTRAQDQSQAFPSHTHPNGYGDTSAYHQSSVNQSSAVPYSAQAYSVALSRLPDMNNLTSGTTHGTHLAIPDVVVRPPSTAPVVSDAYSSRMTGHLQVPDARARSTPAPTIQSTAQATTQSHRFAGHAKAPCHDLPSRFPVYEDASARPSASGTAQPSNASPKRGLTYPGASAPPVVSTVHTNPSNYLGNGGYDPRSPKPPSVSTITPDTSRLQSYTSSSPAAVAHAGSAGSGNTPKHSPSVRLHSHRNGSNDTITHAAPARPSPSGSSPQHLPHRSSAANLQPHANSRPDTTSRQPNTSSAYPDITRYRSPAPSGYPNAHASSSTNNVAASVHSQAYSTQTPVSYDPQYGRAANAPSQAGYAAQTAINQAYGRIGQSLDYGLRSPDPSSTTFAASSYAPTSAQRVPPRSAPSPAPTVRPPRLTLVSSPSSRSPAPLHSAPPVPARNQSYPAPGPAHPTTTQFASGHSRTISDPQYNGRSAPGEYASASLPTRGRNAPAPPTQADVLLTPSSLAPSMLPQSAPPVPLSRTTSQNTTKEKEKKKGFFGLSLFRSRSSPPKEREVDARLPSAAIREKRERKHSQPVQPTQYQAYMPLSGPTKATGMAASVSITAQSQHVRGQSTSAVPIAAPTPVIATPSGQRAPSGKMFTPFRLLSRRHRTVSAASVEAVDGTVINAMLTGGDSTRSSTAGRPSPPLRDPMTAANEWRNREEDEQQHRGTLRRRRPGVTFDVGEEIPDDGRGPMQKTLRQNMQALQASIAAQAQAPGQTQLPTQMQMAVRQATV